LKHEHPPRIETRTMRGAFSLGVLQAVLNGSVDAKQILANNPHLDENEKRELYKRISEANRAKALQEQILESNGYYDEPDGSKLREMRNLDSAEILKGNMEVEVFTFEGCPICTLKTSKIHKLCISQGFPFKLTQLNESDPERNWFLEQWPHIEVDGHEVTEGMLEELTLEATLHRKQRTRAR
jgi:hypothetical protein